MSKADEMFEKLEYKLICSHINPENSTNYQFIYENKQNSPTTIEFRKSEIFGEDYPKELFNRFYSELETYKPKYNDKINHCLYFDLDNGAKIYKNYRNILEKYQKEHNDRAKQRKIEELQKQIDKLKQD